AGDALDDGGIDTAMDDAPRSVVLWPQLQMRRHPRGANLIQDHAEILEPGASGRQGGRVEIAHGRLTSSSHTRRARSAGDAPFAPSNITSMSSRLHPGPRILRMANHPSTRRPMGDIK